MWRERVTSFGEIVGASLVVVGVGLWSVSLALVVAGGAIIAASYLLSRGES